MKTFSIEDFIPERKARRMYENFTFTENTSVAPHVLDVNLDWLSSALKGDIVWAFKEPERVNGTFKPGKYYHWLPLIQNGEPIEAPYLGFSRGRVSIVDGRHRLYAFIDMGYTHCKVVVGDRALVAVSTLVDPEQGVPLRLG
ncbi:hypothetical protein [Paraburkholderia tropica]|uniref:hypothetical protein n=1 Tax=Paraburkholderia tropica TaxID=92647 RepID=UPI0016177090|nr:hypothetical protein [Paraburkholderia tropica]MBB6317322.1 hypothetical protein [Paraburkholderia tropica]